MTAIAFSKMHGLSNDFLLLNALHNRALADITDLSALAKRMCDRTRGVGADGLIMITPPATPELAANVCIINADGSDGGMCGNGLRCAARLLVDTGHIRKNVSMQLAIGKKIITATVDDAGDGAVTIDMGPPNFEAAAIPVDLQHAEVAAPWLVVAAERGIALSMGNPHFVICVDQALDAAVLAARGAALERHPAFPQRTNVQFARLRGAERIDLQPWERGVGATAACGSGACAALVAAVVTGQIEAEAIVTMPGGELWVAWNSSDGVRSRGPAEYICQGNWRGA